MAEPITIDIDEYDSEVKMKTFKKTFKNEHAMYEWFGTKLGHPFLTYKIARVESTEAKESTK